MRRIVAEKVTFARDVDRLIMHMEREIEKLRNIVHRYHILHGEQVYGLPIEEDDSRFIFVLREKNDTLICRKVDTQSVGVNGDYQEIKELLAKLEMK